MENSERLSQNHMPAFIVDGMYISRCLFEEVQRGFYQRVTRSPIENTSGQSVRMEKITVDQTLQLRHSVLWPDMPLSQVCLPEDALGIHLGALLPHSVDPIAVISLFVEPLPIDKTTIPDLTRPGPSANKNNECSEQAVRFRKFACSPRYQGKGLGTHLLKYALSIAQSQHDATVVWCDARTSSSEWYKKRGLLPFGETFFKGPVEYVRMKIYLRDIADIELPMDHTSPSALEA